MTNVHGRGRFVKLVLILLVVLATLIGGAVWRATVADKLWPLDAARPAVKLVSTVPSSVPMQRPPPDTLPNCARFRCTQHESIVYLQWRYRHHRIHRSVWYRHHLRTKPAIERRMMRAYASFTRRHPWRTSKHGVIVRRAKRLESRTAASAAVPASLSAGIISGIGWPSPRHWLDVYIDSVGCAFVGTQRHLSSEYCSARGYGMLVHVVRLESQASRFTLRCAGDFVMGGLAGKGVQHIAAELGRKVAGGWGVVAAAADCAWQDYGKRYFW